MKRMGMLVAAVMLTACGSGSSVGNGGGQDDPREALIGKWFAPLTSMSGCLIGASFNLDNQYELDKICELRDGSWAVEAEGGIFSTDGEVIDFAPTLASCLQSDRNHDPETVAYTVTPTSLRILNPSGGVVMQRTADDPNSLGMGTATIHYGCVNLDAFVPSPVTRL
ncbi:MAG: hypothetical protein SFV15_06360 [Polyangiaceae bacterium]|nr:hypothetical protein [Polyangiaceae bacterium]